MENKIIEVACKCGATHKFAAEHEGKTARCKTTGETFVIRANQKPVLPSDPRPVPTDPPSSGSKALAIVSVVRGAIDSHRQRKEQLRLSQMDCPGCRAKCDKAAFACPRCGCPLQDQRAAFLFMEKRRQEAHELQMARERQALHDSIGARAGPQNISQKVVVNTGRRRGCLGTIIIGLVIIIITVIVILIVVGSTMK